MQSMFSHKNGKKLEIEISSRKNSGKFTSMLKLNNTLINTQKVKEESKMEIRKYCEGAWLGQLLEHPTLDFKGVSLSPQA